MSQTAESSWRVETTTPDTAGRLRGWFSTLFSVLILLAATALVLGTAIQADLPVRSAIAALAALVVTQLLPGFLVWRVVRPLNGWWIEDVMMGLAVGFVLAVGAQTVAGLTGQPWISGTAPSAWRSCCWRCRRLEIGSAGHAPAGCRCGGCHWSR
jgi:hypothetical protein